MITENQSVLRRIDQEQQDELGMIEENRSLFWLVATVACEQSEYGAIIIDVTERTTEGRQPFSYMTQGAIELKDEHLDRLLREYDPHREFVIVFLRSSEHFSVYLGKAPPIGWWEEMVTNTQHLENGTG